MNFCKKCYNFVELLLSDNFYHLQYSNDHFTDVTAISPNIDKNYVQKFKLNNKKFIIDISISKKQLYLVVVFTFM